MNKYEIDEMYTYLLEFTADLLYCAAPYSENKKVLAALTYDPDFKQNFLLSVMNKILLKCQKKQDKELQKLR